MNAAPRRSILHVLRDNPRFRRLWTAQLVSQTGDWLSRTAILGLLSSLGARDALVGVGAMYAFELATRLVPNALLYPLAGPAADRLPRKTLLVGADVVRVFVVLALLTIDRPEELPLLYALIVLQVGFGTFFSAAQSAAIPSTVRPEQLHDAFALSSATWSFTLSLGAALGGVVAHGLGTHGAILADAGTYAVSAVLLAGLRLPPMPRQPERFRARDALLLTDLRRGLAHARERGAGVVLLAKSLWGGAGGFLVALSLLARERFAPLTADGLPTPEHVALVVGLFYGARGVGTGLGPIVARRLAGSSDRALRLQVALGYAIGAGGYALVPTTGSLPLALAFVVLAHSGGSMLWVASTTFWQGRVDDAFRGRIFALEFLGMTLSFALGGLAAAGVFDRTGDLGFTVWTACALVVVGGSTWTLLARNSIRRAPAATA